MKVIYHCYGGAHSSVTAAAVHLGLLPEDRIPAREMFCKLPLYDRQEADEHGHIFFMGIDGAGNEIYLAARRSRPVVLESVFEGLAGIFNVHPEDYLLVNVMHKVNWVMKLGGYLSRRWGVVRLGRPIVTLGTQMAYFRVVELVRQVKSRLEGYGEENTLLQRQQVPPGRLGRRHSHGLPAGGERTRGYPVVEPAVFEFKKKLAGQNNFPGKGRPGK
jgi:hypothetical protein